MMTVVLMLVVIALCVVLELVGSTGEVKVGYLPSATNQAQQLPAIATTIGQRIMPVAVTDPAAAESQLRDGKLKAVLTRSDATVAVMVKKDVNDNLRHAFNLLAGQLASDAQITKLGGDPATTGAPLPPLRHRSARCSRPTRTRSNSSFSASSPAC